nr:RNA-directed DNA polymerase, eukaryota [Tanacetum cinerariifolium]
GVLVNGDWTVIPNDVKNEFLNHFSSQFDRHISHRICLADVFNNQLLLEQQGDLERTVLSKKSKERCGIVAQINPLVPMVSHSNSFEDIGISLRTIFQLLSWISSLQILANRLSSVIPDLISDVKSAFISNRQILDGPFILNELLSWCKHKKLKAMVSKVDFEKAFDSIRGIKQGDPLSPLLFILIMKSLHLSFKKVMNAGLFTGIPLDNSLTISHLFYADDAIFIEKWDSSNLKIILKVLRCFHMASGLKININKSKLIGYGVHSNEVETAARYIGCVTFVAPFSHLGVRVGGRMERINSWNDVVSKVTSRLSKWKIKTLSIGGNERNLALISWDTVLASKKCGGLGVSSFFSMNRGLLSKWVWPFFLSQTSSLWTRTIKAIHGEKGNLGSHGNITRRSPWLDIVREINVLRSKGGIEEERQNMLFSRISGVILSNMRYRWIWFFEASRDFSVTSAHRIINDYLLPKADVQTRWVKFVPIKINVFAWRVRLDKLSNRLNLSLRGVEISSIMCLLCNSSVESA